MNKLKRSVRNTVRWLENRLSGCLIVRLVKPTRF